MLKHVVGLIYRTNETLEDNNNIDRFLVGITQLPQMKSSSGWLKVSFLVCFQTTQVESNRLSSCIESTLMMDRNDRTPILSRTPKIDQNYSCINNPTTKSIQLDRAKLSILLSQLNAIHLNVQTRLFLVEPLPPLIRDQQR